MTFLIYAIWTFAREYRKDKKKEQERKSTFNQTAENLSNGQQKTVRIKTRQIDGTKVAPIDQNGLTKEDGGVGGKVSSDKNTQVMPVAAINQENERSARAQKAWSSEE